MTGSDGSMGTLISDNLKGDILLSSLANFIHSIVQLYSPLSDSAPSSTPNDVTPAGTELVLALKQFIKSTVCRDSEGDEKGGLNLGDHPQKSVATSGSSSLSSLPVKVKVMSRFAECNEVCETTINYRSNIGSSNVAHNDIPTVMTDSAELSSDTLEGLRKRVYNRMPIRLLAFGYSGNEMELLDRQEILQRCARNIANSIQIVHLGLLTLGIMTTEHLIVEYTKYNILSHTWIRDSPGDVIYKDWDSRHLNDQGYSKLKNFTRVSAQEHGITFTWVDTVCINKDSSTELDESIRSMYKWYRNAHICVAYLSETSVLESMHRDSWFTRGWTLQELLASHNIVFYNSSWNSLCTHIQQKVSHIQNQDILAQIEKATGITYNELCHFRQGHLDKVPISRRMQLAAKREVTREEDTAYSLMGILDVDISIAYGEGRRRAFFRLVRELVATKKSILDIFNCALTLEPDGSLNGLIPSDIRQYLRRSSALDITDGDAEYEASHLSCFRPIEPIVYTHLGLRIPLILVPAIPTFCIGGEQYVPLGDFYGTAILRHHAYTVEYFLAQSTIYSANPYRTSIDTAQAARTHYTTFGILNFEIDDEVIMIPRLCLSIPLKRGLKLGAVSPTDHVEILPDNDPAVIELKSKASDNRVPKSELGKHGLQLVTLHL